MKSAQDPLRKLPTLKKKPRLQERETAVNPNSAGLAAPVSSKRRALRSAANLRTIEFFEPPDIPEPKAQRRSAPNRPPEWSGPPENVVPGVVALNLLLVHNERLAVWLPHAEVYRMAILLRVELRGRNPARPGVEVGFGTWRFGVQLSDGQKLTSTRLGSGIPSRSPATTLAVTPGGRDKGPWLYSRGGAVSQSSFRQEYWLWPLPPPGDLLIACEWPNVELPLTTTTISADRLRDAAGQSRELWPTSDVPESPDGQRAPTSQAPLSGHPATSGWWPL